MGCTDPTVLRSREAQCIGKLHKNRVSKKGGRALIGEWMYRRHYRFFKRRSVVAIKKNKIKKLIAVNVNVKKSLCKGN